MGGGGVRRRDMGDQKEEKPDTRALGNHRSKLKSFPVVGRCCRKREN